MLQARTISHYYGTHPVLAEISMTISPAQVIYLGGENGSGKTTLLKILSGLLIPREGEVYWEGQLIRQNRDLFHSKIGFLGHDSYLYPDLTVWENLRFYSRLYRLRNSESLVEGTLARFGIEDKRSSLIRELSYGQKKRVSLVRALLHGPELLFLDEPFSGLDERGREAVARVLEERVHSQTAIVIASPEKERPLSSGRGVCFELKNSRLMEVKYDGTKRI